MGKDSKLLVIGHVWPQPNATAAGEHILHLLDFFIRLNYKILFVSASQQPENYAILNDKNIESQKIKLNDDSFDQLLLNYSPTIVLFDRFMTEEQFSWRVYKQCPEAIRILDTEDLHFLRNQRQNKLKNKNPSALSDIAKREIASIYRCDLSFIISSFEKDLLINKYQIPAEILYYIPLLSSTVSIKQTPVFEKRKDFIFVGNFLHEPNWNCVQYLKKEIWPKLSKSLPKTTLHIYGSHATDKHFQISNPKERFIINGYEKDIEVKLKGAKLLLAPIKFGAGQKGKLLKAMQCGLPSVTSSIGAEGMLFDNKWPGAISDNTSDFIINSISLYNTPEKWNHSIKNIEPLVNTHFNFDLHFNAFKKKLTFFIENIELHRQSNITSQVLWHHSLRSTEFMSRWIIAKNKID